MKSTEQYSNSMIYSVCGWYGTGDYSGETFQMVPLIMMYKVVLTFRPVDKTLVFLTVQMKVAEQFLQLCYYAVKSGSDF